MSSKHLPGLDGLRAVAVIAVLLYHFFPADVPGGFIGVDVFFVISGFLITALLVYEKRQAGRLRLGQFWLRRARRLLPALFFLLLICTSASLLIGQDLLVGIRSQLLGAVTFSSNWLSVWEGSSYFAQNDPHLFKHLWSLAVEEQFYFLWPIALSLILLLPRPRWVIPLILAGVSALLMVLLYSQADPTRAYYGTDSHIFGILLGAVLALAMQSRNLIALSRQIPRILVALLSVGSAALVGLLIFSLPDRGSVSYQGGMLLASMAVCALIWAACFSSLPIIGRLLDNPLFRFIGKRSYGLYLWHWPILVMVIHFFPSVPRTGLTRFYLVMLALLISLPLVMLSYDYLEMPIRRYGFRRYFSYLRHHLVGLKRLIAAGLVGLLVFSVAGTSWAVIQPPAESSSQRFILEGKRFLQQNTDDAKDDAKAAPPPPRPKVDDSADQDQLNEENRKFIDQLAGADIFAIGDSVMLAAAPSLKEAFPRIRIDAEVSRQMWDLPQLLREHKGGLRNILLIGLGTNGTFHPALLQQIRDLVGPHTWLVFITPYAPRDWVPSALRTLKEWVPGREHTALVNWHDSIIKQLNLLVSDHVHPNTGGGQLYAKLVKDKLISLVPMIYE